MNQRGLGANDKSLLQHAVMLEGENKTEILEIILSRASVDDADSQGRTALFDAVQTAQSDISTIKLLLQHRANAMHRDKFGWTPLLAAAELKKG